MIDEMFLLFVIGGIAGFFANQLWCASYSFVMVLLMQRRSLNRPSILDDVEAAGAGSVITATPQEMSDLKEYLRESNRILVPDRSGFGLTVNDVEVRPM